MKETVASRKTGGRFMLETVASSSIFTREKFSEEQKEIEMMVIDFCKGKVFPHRERMEGKDLDFARTLLKEMGELGWLGIPFSEALGGAELGMAEVCVVLEALGAKRPPRCACSRPGSGSSSTTAPRRSPPTAR